MHKYFSHNHTNTIPKSSNRSRKIPMLFICFALFFLLFVIDDDDADDDDDSFDRAYFISIMRQNIAHNYSDRSDWIDDEVYEIFEKILRKNVELASLYLYIHVYSDAIQLLLQYTKIKKKIKEMLYHFIQLFCLSIVCIVVGVAINSSHSSICLRLNWIKQQQ